MGSLTHTLNKDNSQNIALIRYLGASRYAKVGLFACVDTSRAAILRGVSMDSC